MNVLSVNSVEKSFGNFNVLKKLSFSLEKGKVFGLIGPNGAGKTTTINCILNILECEKGSITIFGKTFDGNKNDIVIKKRIGVLFENNENVMPLLKTEEYLRFIGEIYGLANKEAENRINELFVFFGLEDFRHKLIEELSHGTKKKVALASILLYNPDLIIFDEPFESLDTLTQIKVKKIIRRLKQKGKTFLITSHILSYIEDVSDEVVVINKGEIVFRSATKDIRGKIKNELTNETYKSLEEIFIDLTSGEKNEKESLSWF